MSQPIVQPPASGDVEVQEDRQGTLSATLLNAITATNATPPSVSTAGYDFETIEIQKTGTGTVTLLPQGSFDGVVWYAMRYQQIDGVAAPTAAVVAFAVGAGAVNNVLYLLDRAAFPLLRLVPTVTGAVVVTAKVYATPN